MMNDRVKECARELLNGLEEKDLMDLCKTVTKGKFTPKDKQEAVDLIIQYEKDARTLLSRKKISLNLLSQYLHFKGVEYSIDSNKLSLCDYLINYWTNTTGDENCRIQENSSSPPVHTTAVENCRIQENTSASPVHVATGLSDSDVERLGVQFVDWFYSQLRGPDLQLLTLGGEHFFSDASCKISKGSQVHESIGGENCAIIIVEALREVGEAVPIANPSGVKSQVSPHGAVKVVACGTLHSHPAYMRGSFEQAFLLVRDPSAKGNWKIRHTELRINVVSNENEIEDSSSNCLEYTQL